MSRTVGLGFESDFVDLCRERGLSAYTVKGKTWDVVANGLRVQCKHKDFAEEWGGIRVARGQHKYAVGDYDVLAVRHKGRIYLIPANRLDRGDGTLATKIRVANVGRFADAWSVLERKGTEPVDEMPLFGE